MSIRKVLTMVLALILVASLAVPTFAATGYGPGTVNPPSNDTSSSSSGSGGGGGGGVSAYTPPSANNPVPATAAQVAAAATAAINKAASGQQAVVSLTNVSTVPAAALKSVFAQAASAIVQLDAKEGKAIVSRVYIDAATAAQLSGTVDFSVTTKGASVQSTVNTFEKFFDNNVAVIGLGQKGAYGANIKMAVKVDLSKLNTSNLIFYAYNKETGKYARLAVAYRIDANGYLHFTTPVGGAIIISDKPLARK